MDPTDRARRCDREEQGWGREVQKETEVVEIRDGSLPQWEKAGWRRQEKRMEGKEVDGGPPHLSKGGRCCL